AVAFGSDSGRRDGREAADEYVARFRRKIRRRLPGTGRRPSYIAGRHRKNAHEQKRHPVLQRLKIQTDDIKKSYGQKISLRPHPLWRIIRPKTALPMHDLTLSIRKIRPYFPP
ncbi:hypothetical protein, partial [Alistipes ihumii]|uniref:hypothetical protein n=1 Tax=Alistipes ihumii TaxID=1470347 RepID=UPI003AF0E3EC